MKSKTNVKTFFSIFAPHQYEYQIWFEAILKRYGIRTL